MHRTLDGTAADRIVERLLGGSLTTFFDEYWRRTSLHVVAAAPELAGTYGIADFVEDTVAVKSVPYRAVGAHDGTRTSTTHGSAAELVAAVEAGSVASIKMSESWHSARAPERWEPFRVLFGGLCRAVSMLYLSAARSEDVDLFLAGPQSQLGTHYDITDGFTVQLSGERVWTVEETLHLDETLGASRDPHWHPATELTFKGATREIILHEGDALYVPAYTVHRVTSTGWSVSLSLGLRAFNEIDLVEHLLESIRTLRYADYPPLPSFPHDHGEAHVTAKLELVRRVRALLAQLEMASIGTALAPLELPGTLDVR